VGAGQDLWRWVFGKHPPKPPREDHVVELAWLPLWKAQLVLHHLWESGIPTTMSEDHTSQLRYAAREPMARLFVMEVRLAAARRAIAELESRSPDPVEDEV
jgi:hypothetical protein